MEELENIRKLLVEAHDILRSHGENNWIRALSGAIAALDDGDIAETKMIYCSIVAGGRKFAEYYIHFDDYETRVKENKRLGEVKDSLWDLLCECD